MLEFVQKINSVQIKPRKIREFTRLIKHQPILEVKERFQLAPKQLMSTILSKGLGVAIDRISSTAFDPKNFIVKRITCNEGVKFKRRRMRSRGRTVTFTKQRSHINILVAENKTDGTKS